MTNKRKEFLRTVKFFLFSTSAGVIQVLSFTVFEEAMHLTHWVSYLISLVLSVVWNFTLNRKFTFHSANNVPIAMLKVAGYYLVFTPLSTWGVSTLTGIGWNAYLVEGLAMLANFVTECHKQGIRVISCTLHQPFGLRSGQSINRKGVIP